LTAPSHLVEERVHVQRLVGSDFAALLKSVQMQLAHKRRKLVRLEELREDDA
jgi:hypothetical protein